MFPVSFLSGMVFPTIVARIQVEVTDRMNSTGIATLLNTSGAAIGPLVATFVLLPSLGYQPSLICCAAAYALLSIIVTERALWSLRRPTGIILVTLWIALLLGLVFFPYRRTEAHFEHASRPYERDDQGHVLARVVKRIEGTSDTWQLLRRDLFGQAYYYRLLSDCVLDVGHKSAQSALHAIIRLSSSGVASRSERCAAYLLRVRGDCGCVYSQIKSSKESISWTSRRRCSLSLIFIPESITPTRSVIRACTPSFKMGGFSYRRARENTTSFRENRLRRKVAGAVNLYTQEFFSLMQEPPEGRRNRDFLASDQSIKSGRSQGDPARLPQRFSKRLGVGQRRSGLDHDGDQWAGSQRSEDELRQFWNDPATGADLRRIGIEVPQQLGALFLMDGDEIDRITHNIAPLTDIHPKRLTDGPWDDEASHRFALTYFTAPAAFQRFVRFFVD